MAVVTDWTTREYCGWRVIKSYSVIDAPNNSTARTNAIPFDLPDRPITIVAKSTGAFGAAATFDLEGHYDSSSLVTLKSGVIASSTLASEAAGSVDLEQYPAMEYRIAITTTTDESAEDVTFYIMYKSEG